MMTMTACPTEHELKAFAQGLLPELQSDDLFEHLRGCEICRSQLETVENSEDSLIASLRSPDFQSPFDAEAGCQAALARCLGSLAETPLAASKAPEHGGTVEDCSLPQLIGEYELVRPLGRGGMGHVYLARHNKLGREVALKLLASHRLANPRMRERFENEMRAVGRLSHPNIVTAHDAREIDGTAVLVTEFIDGMDLSQLTNRLGRIPIPDACEIIRQVSVALEYTHQQGYVHRDVKPSNIMLSRQGWVTLLDLGLARWQMEDSQQSELTGTGQTMGTADYVAPEQITDSHHVDIRADIYSLGCTLFKLLTGSAPFADEQHLTAFAKMNAHVSTTPPKLSDTLPAAAPELSKLIASMLAKEPDQRPPTPISVAEQLESFSQAGGLNALVQRAELEEAAEPTLQPSRATAVKRPLLQRSVPIWSATIGALATLLLGLCLGILIKIQYPDGTELSLAVPAGSTITQEFVSEADPDAQPEIPEKNGDRRLPGFEDVRTEAEDEDTPFILPLENLQPFSFAILQDELDPDSLEQDARLLRQVSDPHQPLETELGIWFPLAERLEKLPESSYRTDVGERGYLLLKNDRGSVVPWALIARNIGINFRGGGRTATTMEMFFQGPLQRVMRELSTRHLNGYLAMIVNNRVIHVSKIVSSIDRQAVVSGQYAPEDLQFLRHALDGGLVDLPDLKRRSADHQATPGATFPESQPAEAEKQFTVIPLKSMDTNLAIAAVKKFMGDDDLVIDGDVEKKQLWVKGTQERLSKIITFLETIDRSRSQPETLGSNASHFEGAWISSDLGGKKRFRTSIFLIEGTRVLTADIQPDGGLARVRFDDFQWDSKGKIIQLPGLVGKTKFLNNDLLQIVDHTHADPESLLVSRIARVLPRSFADFEKLCQDSKCPVDPESPQLIGFANLWMSRSDSSKRPPSAEPRPPTPQEAFQEWLGASSEDPKEDGDQQKPAESTQNAETRDNRGG